MSKVTEIYADRLVPLLKLNLAQLGKPVPDPATLKAIAISLIEKAEEKKVALTSGALSYIAFLYANVYAPGTVAADVEDVLAKRRDGLLVAELLPIVRSQVAASRGDEKDPDTVALDIASELATQLVKLAG